MPVLLALLHFLAIGGIVMILAAEWALLRGEVDTARVHLLVRADIAYMVFALLVVLSGFARALFGDKPWGYYANNPFFHAKLGVFILIGLISIVPTLHFLRWRGRLARGESALVSVADVQAVTRWVQAELALLPLLPILAVLMARGIPQWS